jgi:hypothetical protein
VKTVQVDSTVVSNPEKVKEEAAANLVQDSLRNALRSANIELGDSAPIHAHIVLDEFTSGSMAKRFWVGWARDVAPSLVKSGFQDAAGKELANAKIHVRGNLVLALIRATTRRGDRWFQVSNRGFSKTLRN